MKFALIIFLLLICGTAMADKAEKMPGRIGVYLTVRDNHLTSPYQMRQLMKTIKASGVDFILPFAVKNTSGHVSWESEIAPKELIRNPQLMEMVTKYAHAEGLKVYPVYCVASEGGESGLNALLRQNPSWAYFYDGERKGYLDLGNKDARKYVVSMITELVSKYDVDGLSLDYMRSPNRIGYADSGRDYFLKKRGVDLAEIVALSPDVDLSTEGGIEARDAMKAAARKHPIWPEWQKFRTQNVNLLTKEIREAVDRIKPGLPISSYCWGYTTYTRTYEACQDWVTWIKKGHLDWINPTGYRYDDEVFLDTAKQNRALIPKGFPFYVTIGVTTSHGRLETAEDVKRQMRMCKEAGADGIVFFRWNNLEPFLPEVAETIKAWPNQP